MKKIMIVFFASVLLCCSPVLVFCKPFLNWFNMNYVTDMVSIDSKVCIGTSKGLAIFEPSPGDFVILNKSFGLIDNYVNGLECIGENVFVFTPSGITIYSTSMDSIRNISLVFSGIEGEPLTGFSCGDTLFLGTSRMLYIWDTDGNPFDPMNNSWTSHPYSFRDNRITSIFYRLDTLFVGTDQGICGVPDNNYSDSTVWVWNTTAQGLPSDTVTAITFWKDALWVGTKNGITSGALSNWTMKNTGLVNQEINRFFVSGNLLWTATENSPHYWNDTISSWVRVYQGLGSVRRIRGLAEDDSKKLWIGTDGDGIAFLDDTLWHAERIPGPSSSNFSDIAIDGNGDIWGVHYGGYVSESRGRTISHYHNGKWEILNDPDTLGLDGAIRWVDVDRDNNKWFGVWALGSDNDIIKLSKEGIWDTFKLPVSGVIGSQFIDREGNKWFSNFLSSVCRLSIDDSTWTVFTDENNLDYIVSFAEDTSGNMYFGSTDRGISVLRKDGSWFKIGGLPSEKVFDLSFDRNGDLWCGTAAGVAVIRDFSVIMHYTSSSGLMGDNVMDIVIDWKGNKWFLVENKGVSVIGYDNGWDSLTVSDGLCSNFILDDLDGLAFGIENGYLWIATKDGISRYETGLIPPAPDIGYVDVYPNPFIPAKHHKITFNKISSDAKIFIFSTSLKKVRTLEDVEELTHRAFWDGKDRNGKPVDSGVYIYLIIDSQGRKKTGKIAVVR